MGIYRPWGLKNLFLMGRNDYRCMDGVLVTVCHCDKIPKQISLKEE
jgi:hypothetical protein